MYLDLSVGYSVLDLDRQKEREMGRRNIIGASSLRLVRLLLLGRVLYDEGIAVSA